MISRPKGTYDQFAFPFEIAVSDLDQTVVVLSFSKGSAVDVGAEPTEAGENSRIKGGLWQMNTHKEMLCRR